jgi:hypothetical protein
MSPRQKLAVVLCLAVGSSIVFAPGQQTSATARTLVRAGHLLDAKTGSIEPGHWADIIAVEQNPLQDVRVLQHVNFVMKSGVVYKNETCKQEAACP